MALQFNSLDSTTVEVDFPELMSVDGISDPSHFRLGAKGEASPVLVLASTSVQELIQEGSTGQVVPSEGRSFTSVRFDTVTGSFLPTHIGDYLYFDGVSFDPLVAYRIVSFLGSVVTLDKTLVCADPGNGTYVPPVDPWGPGSFLPGTGTIGWQHRRAASGAVLTVTETSLGKTYVGEVLGLTPKNSVSTFSGVSEFVASGAKPRLVAAYCVAEDGSVIASFDKDMQPDLALMSPSEYQILGPEDQVVQIHGVQSVDQRSVRLLTSDMGTGIYRLVVNTSGTPRDLVGNPLDPSYGEVEFVSTVPILSRSVFTDRGPLTKSELTIQSGNSATIQTSVTQHFGSVTLNEVVLPGGSFDSSHVGKYLRLMGSSSNDGSYLVTKVLGSIRLRVQASFHLPDSANGSISWSLVDPRVGEIADSPSDVIVRINGHRVAVQAVSGLLGKIVLDTPPAPEDDVKVDYSWVPDPTVEIQRLNSREFRLNGWLGNVGNRSSHFYQCRNVLASPVDSHGSGLLAKQTQPLLRELHYRAFERAYSVAFNDPSLFVFNNPLHRVAYPSLSREVAEVSVLYQADNLPEVDKVPWDRRGSGLASIVSGNLLVQDNTSGPFPMGNPIFWTQGVDLSFPCVYAATWRMRINESTPNGVYTGVSVGFSDETHALVLGYLIHNGVRKIGFLRRGYGGQQASLEAWVGGLDSFGNATELPFNFDWSVLHSYRLLRDRDGVTRFYVDGEVVESLRITEDQQPFLDELGDPFNEVQNVFFGSLSREALSTSTWDFVRYVVIPINLGQSAPSVFVSYEGDTYPEVSPSPWTPIGYHGNESLVEGELYVASTSATDAATSSEVGLIGGDFRGFTRIEPLLSVASSVVLDLGLYLRTFTHGISPNSVMAAIDDGTRLVQLSFFPFVAQPKLSYPGRSMPQDATPKHWTSLGGASAEMVGRVLRIEDTTLTDGRVFAISDLEPIGSSRRIIEASLDWYVEFKCKVFEYTPDGSPDNNFCGVTVDVFDGTRTLGVMTRQDPITGDLQIAFHSDGQHRSGPNAFCKFNWADGAVHVYRLVKSTAGNLVNLFIDNKFIGSYPYTGFEVAYEGDPTYSFGSSTVVSHLARSVVEWHYANIWRAQPASGTAKYLGIWKGSDSSSLLDYHLPLKAKGSGFMAGNALTDDSQDFLGLGVQAGDHLIVDHESNQGVYEVQTVSPNTVTIQGAFPLSGRTRSGYRIPATFDWRSPHKYRLVKDPSGYVALLIDSSTEPLIRVDYSEVNLPSSSLGTPHRINRGLPSISWGSLDPENLVETAWDFVRYGITRAPSEKRIAAHHQFLNQRGVMSSPEHLFGSVAHSHTQHTVSSTGVPHPWEEYNSIPGVTAFTMLNEGTPLVPQTQTYEVRRPRPQVTFISTLNSPSDVLNSSGFQLNDSSSEVKIIVPNDVLYNSLQVLEQSSGAPDLIAPVSDESGLVQVGDLSWNKAICYSYEADVLPEQDGSYHTPWVLDSEEPLQVSASVAGSVLTYSLGSEPTQTIYRNATPITDPVGLTTRVDFRLRLANDATSGMGDTGVRFGFSAIGITAALAFVPTPTGEREVRLIDLNSNEILGAISFDYLDEDFHTYRLTKNAIDGTIDFSIDP